MFDYDLSSGMPLYLKHVLIAWPGLFILTVLVGMLLSATPLDLLFSEYGAPWFPGWIIFGLVAGYLINRREVAGIAVLSFVPALAAFSLNAWGVVATPSPYGGWVYFWHQYFSSHCSDSECLGELIFTWPLYAGIAYSLGALWAWHRGRTSPARDERSETAI